MRFWLREVAGWFVVAIGLYVFYLCYQLLLGHFIVETGTLTVIGIFLFRGGIHLLKMAVAARVCMEAQQRPTPVEAPRRGRTIQPRATPWEKGPGRL